MACEQKESKIVPPSPDAIVVCKTVAGTEVATAVFLDLG